MLVTDGCIREAFDHGFKPSGRVVHYSLCLLLQLLGFLLGCNDTGPVQVHQDGRLIVPDEAQTFADGLCSGHSRRQLLLHMWLMVLSVVLHRRADIAAE